MAPSNATASADGEEVVIAQLESRSEVVAETGTERSYRNSDNIRMKTMKKLMKKIQHMMSMLLGKMKKRIKAELAILKQELKSLKCKVMCKLKLHNRKPAKVISIKAARKYKNKNKK